jgi:hypothetical protein
MEYLLLIVPAVMLVAYGLALSGVWDNIFKRKGHDDEE